MPISFNYCDIFGENVVDEINGVSYCQSQNLLKATVCVHVTDFVNMKATFVFRSSPL